MRNPQIQSPPYYLPQFPCKMGNSYTTNKIHNNDTYFVPIIKHYTHMKLPIDNESPDTYSLNSVLFMKKFDKANRILVLAFKREQNAHLITNLQISTEPNVKGYTKLDYQFGFNIADRYLHIQIFYPLQYAYANNTLSIYPSIDVEWFPSGCINMVLV